MSLFKLFSTIALLAILPHACYTNPPAPSTDSLTKDISNPVKSSQQAEEQVSTQHQIQLDGQTINYTATAGNYLLKDDKGDPKGSIFFISYLKDDVANKTDRPITFCFNGGPGSASIWLHMGAFGPKRVLLSEEGLATPPYSTVSNDYSILDLTDLVFIDPVSTGYSRPVAGEDPKQFYGVEEDTKWVAEFIRLYVTRLARWNSPKFVAGESYGGTRAAALSKYLQETINMDLNGVILISPVLDFNTHQSCSNPTDLSFALCVPTLAAAAHYHKKTFLTESFPEIIKQAEEFALGDYYLALLQGSDLSQKRFQETAIALSKFSGLPIDYIERAKLRVHYLRFCKELLKSQERTLGRFDSRYLGIDGDHCGSFPEYDPSLDMIIGAFSATFNQYVREDLHWVRDDHYKVLIDLSPWNWGKSTNQSLNVSDDLREAMTRNPSLNVFVASGYYDLATPYFATRYTFNHLGLDPAIRPHLTQTTYEAGHMLYTSKLSLMALKKDLKAFYHLTLPPKQQQ